VHHPAEALDLVGVHPVAPVDEGVQQRAGERHLERALGDGREARTAAR
jgi:hypothetical protein